MSAVWGKGKRKSAIVRRGSPWTNAKLDALATYLRGYTIAGLQHRGTKTFVDAVVGASYREVRDAIAAETLLMPDLAAAEPQALLDGMARMALETNPAFHAYRFIDRSRTRRTAIKRLGAAFIDRDKMVRSGVARDELGVMSALDWKAHRAVLFLDPFGMDIEWVTIEAIARTQAIDLWLWYPLGIGVARLVAADVPATWRSHLDRLLGTEAWHDDFLAAAPAPTLFRDEQGIVTAKAAVLGRYFVDRLRSVFPTVAEQACVLRGPARQPLYLCCFAAGDASNSATAVRFANNLLARLDT